MKQVRNASYNKAYNRRQILKYLRREPLSRAELSRMTGLTRAAISILAEELLQEGIIRESEQRADVSVGRMPVLLTVVPESFYGVGISVSRSGVEIGISDFSGRVLQSVSVNMEVSAEQTLHAAGEASLALLQSLSIPREKTLGVGVSAPGPLNDFSGVILAPPLFPGWHDVPVAQLLRDVIGLPVCLENDANAMALHRYLQGMTNGSESFLLLLVNDGVGSGIVVGGRLLRTGEGFSAELGHTSIDYRGRRCDCGGRGCLECYASIPAMLKRFPDYESWNALMHSKDADAASSQEALYLYSGVRNLRRIISVDTLMLSGALADIPGTVPERLQRAFEEADDPVKVIVSPVRPEDRISAAANLIFSDYLGIL